MMQDAAMPVRGLRRFLRRSTPGVVRDPAALTKRNRITFAAASLLTLVASYFLLIKPENTRLKETRVQAEQAEATVQQLRSELAHLRSLERREGELTEQAGRLAEALPMETHLAKFILQVQDASNQAKLEWVSVNPTPPVASGAAPGLMESTVTMAAAGPYAAVQDFLARLENLQRALKISSIELSRADEGNADPETTLNLNMTLKMFVAPSAPPLPADTAPGAATAPPGAPAGDGSALNPENRTA